VQHKKAIFLSAAPPRSEQRISAEAQKGCGHSEKARKKTD